MLIVEFDLNVQFLRSKIRNLPATTRLVPTNESIIVACFGPNSASARDARRHNRVAIPSIKAPKYGFTYK